MAANTFIAISELHPNFSHPVSLDDFLQFTRQEKGKYR